MAFGNVSRSCSASLPNDSASGRKYVSASPFSYCASTNANTAFESSKVSQSAILVDRSRRAFPPNHLCFDKYSGSSADSNRFRPAPSSKRSQLSATRGDESKWLAASTSLDSPCNSSQKKAYGPSVAGR